MQFTLINPLNQPCDSRVETLYYFPTFYFTFCETLIYFRAKSSGHRFQARVLRQRVSRCVSRVLLALLHFYTIFCVARKQSHGRDRTMRQQQKCVWQLCLCVFIHIRAPPGYSSLSAQQPAVRPAVLFAARFSLHFCVNSLRALAAAAEQLSRILRCFFYSLER